MEIENEDNDSEKLNIELELNECRGKYNDIIEQLNETESRNTKAQEDYRISEMSYIKLEGELNNLSEQINNLENQLVFQKETAENKQEELDLTANEIHNLKEKINLLNEEIEELRLNGNEATARCDLLSEQLDSLQEQLEQHLKDLNERRKAHDREIQSLHQIDLKLNEINLQLENLNGRARERFEMNLNDIEIIPDENFDVDSSRQLVNELRVKLSTLGSVNFLALEEFEKESERLNFYKNQVNDLKDSKKTLQETITEINFTAEEKFISTFGQIKKNFKNLFNTLFGGEAEAELGLAEGNPLEADIEIIAKPPGKKPHSIEMISSGEKTLTAIALLFAIYLVKPSPFCILDEVDAPLDDANIDRFINLIREFSGNTQFIIITHNKRTMEAADTLYGITMQEDGISKVVSARLSRVNGNEKVLI
jgi:chromosome segregation protein